MRLALQTDFALRTLLYLGTRLERVTVREVAEFFEISPHHLGKVVHQLGRLGYLRNQRGPNGGIELIRPVETISVGEVIRAFEGVGTHWLDCLKTPGVCVIQPGCALRGVFAEAERRQWEYLDGVMLATLLPESGEMVTLREA